MLITGWMIRIWHPTCSCEPNMTSCSGERRKDSFEQLVGKMIGLLARYEAGSQVFLRVRNFKSLRQVASYAI